MFENWRWLDKHRRRGLLNDVAINQQSTTCRATTTSAATVSASASTTTACTSACRSMVLEGCQHFVRCRLILNKDIALTGGSRTASLPMERVIDKIERALLLKAPCRWICNLHNFGLGWIIFAECRFLLAPIGRRDNVREPKDTVAFILKGNFSTKLLT